MWKSSDLTRVTQLTGDRKPWNSGWGRDLTPKPIEYKHQEQPHLHSSCPGLPAPLTPDASCHSANRGFPSPCARPSLPAFLSPPPRHSHLPSHPVHAQPKSFLLPIQSLPTKVETLDAGFLSRVLTLPRWALVTMSTVWYPL